MADTPRTTPDPLDPHAPLDPREIARQLGYTLRGQDPNVKPDVRGGYHPRKGYRAIPPATDKDSDPHGVIVWAIDPTNVKQD